MHFNMHLRFSTAEHDWLKIMSDFFFATWIYIFRYFRNLAQYAHKCISQMIWIVEICLFSWINLDYLKLIFVSHTWYCSASFPALLSKTALFIRAINFISLFFFCPVIALQFSSRSVQFSIRAPNFKSRVTLMPRETWVFQVSISETWLIDSNQYIYMNLNQGRQK